MLHLASTVAGERGAQRFMTLQNSVERALESIAVEEAV